MSASMRKENGCRGMIDVSESSSSEFESYPYEDARPGASEGTHDRRGLGVT